jgi:nucleoside-diphosphate-sugar epimerase
MRPASPRVGPAGRDYDLNVSVESLQTVRRGPRLNRLITLLEGDGSYDITAARTDLGYIPQAPLVEGLAEMIAG